jgi:hypothetical protein
MRNGLVREAVGDSAPWLRLERRGDAILAQGSADGASWTDLHIETFSGLPPALYVGVALADQIAASEDGFEAAQVRLSGVKLERLPPGVIFRRGDCNDDGAVDISDAVSTLGSLFLGDGDPACDDACDSNDDGAVDLSDALATLGVLFLGEGEMPPPGRNRCGPDPTEDPLACNRYERCP